MTRVGITGAAGLLGWHLRCRLHVTEGVKVIPADRQDFASAESLDRFVRECDVIVHFAGMNRGDDAEIERTNQGLARALVEAMERQSLRPQVVYSSTTQYQRDTPYGRGKRIAGEIFAEWAARSGAVFTNMILPHVFGECGRPFYNSVVSTFCSQLARGETPRIIQDGQLELLHAQEVAEEVLKVVSARHNGDWRPHGRPMLVSEMLARVTEMSGRYASGVIPPFKDSFDLRLFNTLRSYLYPERYPVALTLRTDARGSLFEAVKTDHGGQAFVSSTKPGISRGNHFHFNKIERFLVIGGEAVIRLRRLCDSQVKEFAVSGANPVFLDMPTLHTHSITNTGGGELLTLFWSHEIFDPDRPDTYAEPVQLAHG